MTQFPAGLAPVPTATPQGVRLSTVPQGDNGLLDDDVIQQIIGQILDQDAHSKQFQGRAAENLGTAFNLVGGQLSFIPGLGEARGIGTKLFGTRSPQGLDRLAGLLQQAQDVSGRSRLQKENSENILDLQKTLLDMKRDDMRVAHKHNMELTNQQAELAAENAKLQASLQKERDELQFRQRKEEMREKFGQRMDELKFTSNQREALMELGARNELESLSQKHFNTIALMASKQGFEEKMQRLGFADQLELLKDNQAFQLTLESRREKGQEADRALRKTLGQQEIQGRVEQTKIETAGRAAAAGAKAASDADAAQLKRDQFEEPIANAVSAIQGDVVPVANEALAGEVGGTPLTDVATLFMGSDGARRKEMQAGNFTEKEAKVIDNAARSFLDSVGGVGSDFTERIGTALGPTAGKSSHIQHLVSTVRGPAEQQFEATLQQKLGNMFGGGTGAEGSDRRAAVFQRTVGAYADAGHALELAVRSKIPDYLKTRQADQAAGLLFELMQDDVTRMEAIDSAAGHSLKLALNKHRPGAGTSKDLKTAVDRLGSLRQFANENTPNVLARVRDAGDVSQVLQRAKAGDAPLSELFTTALSRSVIQPGDVMREFGGRPFRSVEDTKQFLDSSQAGIEPTRNKLFQLLNRKVSPRTVTLSRLLQEQ